MKKVSELVTDELLQNGSQTQIGSRVISAKEIQITEMIFQTFTAIYPFWMYQRAADDVRAAKRLWTRSLVGMPPAAIERGLSACCQDLGHKSGPTISEFLKLCRIEPAHKNFKLALPRPKNYQTGIEALDAIKKKLGVSKCQRQDGL